MEIIIETFPKSKSNSVGRCHTVADGVVGVVVVVVLPTSKFLTFRKIFALKTNSNSYNYKHIRVVSANESNSKSLLCK